MEIFTYTFEINTSGFNDIINITKKIEKFISENNFVEGNVTVFCPGSTAGISSMEYEDNLIIDIKETFEKIAPIKKDYHHHKTWNDDNGSSHIRSSIVKPSMTIPFIEGKLILGSWQEIVFMDFDTRPRKRTIVVQIIGNKRK